MLFWLLVLLFVRNPNCVPTPDPRKINDGHNSHIVCDVDNIKGIGVVVVAAIVAPAPTPGAGVVVVLASAGLLLWLLLLLLCCC